MTRLYFLLTLLFSLSSNAQKVLPLFNDNSLKTFVTMPFKLQNSSNDSLPIFSLEIVTGKSNCSAIIDPFISSNFLIKCSNPDTVSVNVFYYINEQLNKITYGPLNIIKISDSGVVQPINNDSDAYAAGRTLFQSKCLSCHNSPYETLTYNKTATQIKSAIDSAVSNNRPMGYAQYGLSLLTTAEIKSISDYLRNLP